MNFRRAPIRHFCALLLIGAGISGILFSPSVGVAGGIELRSFTLRNIQEYSWGSTISSAEFEVPYIQNQRGLFRMNLFIAGSVGAIFAGVHWLAALKRPGLLA